jgi:glycosyltransferase involved in cell wall biosynthesis
MNDLFEKDPYPGKPRILFVGLAEDTHTCSWIDLLENAELNVRLFAGPRGLPPDNWRVKTYVTALRRTELDPDMRIWLYPKNGVVRRARRNVAQLLGTWNANELESRWLAKAIRRWQPDIIHTLGLDHAGYFYSEVREKYRLYGIGKWVLQTRGGSDLALHHLNPSLSGRIAGNLRACDQLLCDNQQNLRIAREMGVKEDQLSFGTVPGSGGIDVDAMAKAWGGSPSRRRVILLPKVYESPWTKALPVFEALEQSWERIQPCEIHMLSMTPETRMWFWALPERIRAKCRTEDRIPRPRVLELMLRARVMLAPSLVDGTPNSMFEAMAAGALPVVSPLETIRSVVEHERNVLFARNLHPSEIADALVRAMNDDQLVDRAAAENLELVRRIANRTEIRPRVIGFYQSLVEGRVADTVSSRSNPVAIVRRGSEV